MKAKKLYNGVTIPNIGIGTWQINNKEDLKKIIIRGIECEYSLIDTAAAYCNEIAIGKALKESEIDRNKLFISGKVWNTNRGHNEVVKACKTSLRKLKLDYFDSYLVHWPASKKMYTNWSEINADTWLGMERLYREGLVRSIGVCNFKEHHLEELKKQSEIKPMINQFELHPGMPQMRLSEYCKLNGIVVEASSPLGNGQILHNEELRKIACLRNKTVAQVCLRWIIQKGAIAIPKTVSINRLIENSSIFDFELSDAEMKRIDDVEYCGGLNIDPDEVTDFG